MCHKLGSNVEFSSFKGPTSLSLPPKSLLTPSSMVPSRPHTHLCISRHRKHMVTVPVTADHCLTGTYSKEPTAARCAGKLPRRRNLLRLGLSTSPVGRMWVSPVPWWRACRRRLCRPDRASMAVTAPPRPSYFLCPQRTVFISFTNACMCFKIKHA